VHFRVIEADHFRGSRSPGALADLSDACSPSLPPRARFIIILIILFARARSLRADNAESSRRTPLDIEGYREIKERVNGKNVHFSRRDDADRFLQPLAITRAAALRPFQIARDAGTLSASRLDGYTIGFSFFLAIM